MSRNFEVIKTDNERLPWEIRLDLRSVGGGNLLICAVQEEKEAKWIIQCLELGREWQRNKRTTKSIDAVGVVDGTKPNYGKITPC